VLRYVLAGEFRLDLSCDPPASLDSVAKPPTKDEESAVRELARRLRTGHADAYAALADRVEEELGLKNAKLPPARSAPSTRSASRNARCSSRGDLIANGKFDEALALVASESRASGLTVTSARKAQWEATRRMAELGHLAVQVKAAVGKTSGDAATWLEAYTQSGRLVPPRPGPAPLEAWVANLDEEPEERPLAVVRRAYEDAVPRDGRGLHQGARQGRVDGARRSLHQTRIWSEVVSDKPKPVAYFLVDAMRFEMGVELAERLPKTEVSVRAAVGALPSITPIGMAALMPGASGELLASSSRRASSAPHRRRLPARSRGPEEARGGARAEARRPRARRAAQPPALEAREEGRGRAGRGRSLPGDRPRRRERASRSRRGR
jgi:hypothetical protein